RSRPPAPSDAAPRRSAAGLAEHHPVHCPGAPAEPAAGMADTDRQRLCRAGMPGTLLLLLTGPWLRHRLALAGGFAGCSLPACVLAAMLRPGVPQCLAHPRDPARTGADITAAAGPDAATGHPGGPSARPGRGRALSTQPAQALSA